MDSFFVNGYLWRIKQVPYASPMLIEKTGTRTVATTDLITRTVYLLDTLEGSFFTTVLLHELGHVVMFSYGLLDDVHRAVPRHLWIDAEEWVCNFIADYGLQIFQIASTVLGEEAWSFIPYELERLVV